MKTKRLDEQELAACFHDGEQADNLLKEGHMREALKAFADMSQRLESSGSFDSFLAAKVTLGLLRCYVKTGDFKSAYQVWNADLENSFHGIGIYALESAQTTVKDMVSYDMICAFLHTLGDSDKDQAASAVNQYLSRVCEQALEEGNRGLMKTAISNWKQHLRDLYGSRLPIAFAHALIRFEKLLGETVKPQPIDFPAGSAWEKPRDFLEMSRFTDIKKVKRPGGKGKRAS